MEKRQTYTSSLTLRQMRIEILLQAERVVQEVKTSLGELDPFSALAELRFQKTIRDEMFGERMNFEEYAA